jgi:hypothetical protein
LAHKSAQGSNNLLLLGDANYSFASNGNDFSTLAIDIAGSITLKNDKALTIGTVSGVEGVVAGGGISIATTSGNISITQQLGDGGPVTLVSADSISEGGFGTIDATKLAGSSTGKTTLSRTNVITDLGTFTSGSTFELTDDHDLTVDGTVDAGPPTVELTTQVRITTSPSTPRSRVARPTRSLRLRSARTARATSMPQSWKVLLSASLK